MTHEALLLRPTDDVAVALTQLTAGQTMTVVGHPDLLLVVSNDVPFGHKVAIRDVAVGDVVHKLGHAIGIASRPISAGEHVHIHNIASQRGRRFE